MEKEKIFSKFNMTKYNNQLEDILEKKSYSENAKNILLNILYKIETSYDDYNKVKIETNSKKDIIEEVINTISKKCKEIKLIKPKINEEARFQNKRYRIEKNKIIAYPSEKTLFHALCKLDCDKFKIKKDYSVIQKPMEDLLNSGYATDLSEIVRDFDGWAWNVSSDDIENITYNLVYQNIKMLVGQSFIQECISLNMGRINFIDRLEKKLDSLYSEEISDKLKESIYFISVLEYIRNNKEILDSLIKQKENVIKEFNRINDKKKYLQSIANKKKLISKQIKEIDEALNNNKVLRMKFKQENTKLAEKEKIFSLSEYVDKLQQDREVLLTKLKQFSNLMKPMVYVKDKYNIKRKYDILNSIDLEKDISKQTRKALIEMQILFMRAMQEKLGRAQSKKKIIEGFYLFRYYKLLNFNKSKQVKDVDELKEQLEMAEKYLITRACNLKLVNSFSNNPEKNYEVISKILESRIIDLDELNVQFKKKDEDLILNIYDDNMIDRTIKFSIKDDIKARRNRRIKLFI